MIISTTASTSAIARAFDTMLNEGRWNERFLAFFAPGTTPPSNIDTGVLLFWPTSASSSYNADSIRLLARHVLLIARKYVHRPTPPINNGMEMGRRIEEAAAFHGIRLPSPNPPRALVVYIHDVVPAPIAASPSVS